MAKRVTQMNDNGQIVEHKATRARRKSEETEIPWSKGPQTRGQRIARALWG